MNVVTNRKYYCLEPENFVKFAEFLGFKKMSENNVVDEYFIDYDTGVVILNGEGNMTDYTQYLNSPWYSMRNYIRLMRIEYGITSIGNYAFKDFDKIELIIIPASIIKIVITE